jgi:hypothetical protein
MTAWGIVTAHCSFGGDVCCVLRTHCCTDVARLLLVVVPAVSQEYWGVLLGV